MVSLIKKEIPNSELDKQLEFGITINLSFILNLWRFSLFDL